MIKQTLTAAGIPHKPARFPDPPQGAYAIYFDSVSTDGPDLGQSTHEVHDDTVELYAPSIESGTEALNRLRTQLESRGIRYTTQGWYWLDSLRRYQEIVEFSHIVKL